jgi:hypothetical protein
LGHAVAPGLVSSVGGGFWLPIIGITSEFSQGGVMMSKFLMASISVSNNVWASVPPAHFNFSSAAWRCVAIRASAHRQ